jgi:WD40 repeat protein
MIQTLRHGDGLFGVAYSPDGTILATAGDGPVKLWDVASGRQVRSLSQNDAVMTVAFSPDGTLLASGGYDQKVYLWGLPH